MNIKIDQRRCGAGKTTSTLYQHIDRCIALNQPTLIVVPSIKLQGQYQQRYPDLIVVNSENTPESSVNKAIIQLMMYARPLICITHQSFLLLQDVEQKHQYVLIIDESLDNLYVKLAVPTYHNNGLVKVFWENHFSLISTPEFDYALANPTVSGNKLSYSNSDFAVVEVVNSSEDEICVNSRQYQQMTSKNYTWYISPDDYKTMQTGRADYFTLFGIVKAQVMLGWQSILIAAAAFEFTKMSHWLALQELPTQTLDGCQFTGHSNTVTIHYADISLWSLSKQRSQKDYVDSYEQQTDAYINNIIQHQHFIALRNKNKAKCISSASHEHVVGHNVHGLNDPKFASCAHVVIQSALNLDKQFEAFLRARFISAIPELMQEDCIAQMHCVNLFYQVIMRSSLRNGGGCDVFVMDRRVARLLLTYFPQANLVAIPMTSPQSLLNQTNAKKAAKQSKWQQQLTELLDKQTRRALTDAERGKLHRLRKKLGITVRTSS